MQKALLTQAGAERIFEESFTGTKRNRPELDKLMATIKSGDTLGRIAINHGTTVPMIAEGQDFLRTKHGKNNTYLDGEENALDYARMKKFAGTQEFVSAWIRFRLSPDGRLFRQRSNVSKGFFRFYPDQTNTAVVAVYNDNHAQGRSNALPRHPLRHPRLSPTALAASSRAVVFVQCASIVFTGTV